MKTKIIVGVVFGVFLLTTSVLVAKSFKTPSELPHVQNKAHFISLMKDIQKEENRYNFFFSGTENTISNIDMAFSDSSADFSTTNVQAEGVDEADFVKTDGNFLYQLSNNELVISDVKNPNNLKAVNHLSFEKEFTPQEFYIDDKFLTLIGVGNSYNVQETTILVYHLNNRSNLELVKTASIKGNYVSSRKIGNDVYVVSNEYLNWIEPYQVDHSILPSYTDSALGNKIQTLSWEDIHYFPEFKEMSYLHIAGLNLNKLEKPIHLSSYLGASDTIYASTQHLYVVAEEGNAHNGSFSAFSDFNFSQNTKTTIFKFKFDKGKTEFMASTEVKGQLLNQFSMDEHDGYFRIATTVGSVLDNVKLSTNHLMIFDEKLNKVGAIDDIAPGEKIYSVRFMGDRGYMVTFKKVDPLFVFDLKNPSNPTILGKLKIPGYSDYLHPYDENHLIGIGKDTEEAKEGDFAYYQGMKMALFDITDVNNPKEKFVEIIGDRGTESEVLNNHKALLFSKEKNLIAFPVTLHELADGKQNDYNNAYGEFAFQGAYVYGLDLEKGFTVKKQISHLSDSDMLKSGYTSNENLFVKRILYINDDLYTISNGKIEAHNLRDFAKTGDLPLHK